jgi:PAS domain S-box-containing protein
MTTTRDKIIAMLEEMIQKSEMQLHTAVNAAPLILGSFDDKGICTLLEGRGLTTLGLKSSDIVGKSIFDLYGSKPKVLEIFERAMNGREITEVLKIGDAWSEINVSPFKNEYDKAIGVIGVACDITGRRQAEEALKESEERYRLLFEVSPVGIGILDLKGNIYDGNRTMQKMSGYTKKELKNISFASSCATPNEWKRLLKILKKSGRVRDFELKLMRKDGTVYVALINVDCVELGEKKVLLTTSRDITRRKKAEEELVKNQKVLEFSARNLKKFSRRLLTIREEEKKKLSINLHDELSSMVVDLSSKLDIAEEDLRNNEIKSTLKNIRQTRRALKNAVNRLKRIAADLMPPHLDTVGLGEVLRDYISNISKQVNFKIYFDAKIGRRKIKEDVSIAIYRVIQESLNNIIKHAKAKKASIRLAFKSNKLKITINDDGKGFNIQKLQEHDGLKMGIRGMRERIEEIRGEFNIKSALGKGTKINITV